MSVPAVPAPSRYRVSIIAVQQRKFAGRRSHPIFKSFRNEKPTQEAGLKLSV
jgi:hypothetical protein